ncbi:GNAT family N-acetyltransferase [Natronorarus salvus]|uniref:GNAT family N-acetyltransferase n=1 Tax=Natronorarus salvus TaxID=3117733 RepID=UPI002F25FA21
MSTLTTDPDGYAIRPFETDDREAFVDLYTETFGPVDERWFAWKYEANPVSAEVPILVAEFDETLAGARPCVPFEVAAGGETALAIRWGDTMVHAEHRRRGLFTRMTRRMMDRYREGEPAFAFNNPNERSLPGYRKMGGRIARTMEDYYRIQDPGPILAAESEGAVPTTLRRVSGRVAGRYAGVRTRIGSALYDATGIAVERHDSVPSETFVDIYERMRPDRVHARRTRSSYDWRFGNPDWTYTAYVARRDGVPVAGIVAGRREVDGVATTNLAEVLPLLATDCNPAAGSALLSRVLRDSRDSHLVTHRGRSLPASLLRAYGFVPSDSWPLARATDEAPLLVYDLSGEGESAWQVNGLTLLCPDNWLLSSYEQDAR